MNEIKKAQVSTDKGSKNGFTREQQKTIAVPTKSALTKEPHKLLRLAFFILSSLKIEWLLGIRDPP